MEKYQIKKTHKDVEIVKNLVKNEKSEELIYFVKLHGPEKLNFLIMLAVASELVDHTRLEKEFNLENTKDQSYLQNILTEKIMPKY